MKNHSWRWLMRNPINTAVMVVALCALVTTLALADVTTATHNTYSLRPCSTCKEIKHPTEAQCREAAQAEARRVGETRATGEAVYTCITRHNVIATFRANPPPLPEPEPSAILSWTPPTRNTNGSTLTNLVGYRVHYGRSPGELTQVVQIANPAARGAGVMNLSPGVWYFAVRAYTSDGTQSALTPVWTRTVP